MPSSKIEPLHDEVLAFKVKIDKVFNRACSSMLKFKHYMDLISELQALTEAENSLSRNDMKVIFALMNRAMRAL